MPMLFNKNMKGNSAMNTIIIEAKKNDSS